jgi:hypothetical protein
MRKIMAKDNLTFDDFCEAVSVDAPTCEKGPFDEPNYGSTAWR